MKAVLALVIIAALLAGCTGMPEPSLNGPGSAGTDEKKICAIDADCVQEQCCHATSAVNKNYGPNCTAVACTMDCAPNTLDCGQGTIQCIQKQCTVILYPT